MDLEIIGQQLEKRLHISPWKLRFFRRYARRFLAKNFHAVRLLKQDYPYHKDLNLNDIAGSEGPFIIAANHPSWWDPMIAIYLGDRLGAKLQHFAPIEDVMLERYGIFKNLGFYGIEKNTVSGLKDFLNVGRHILANKNSVIWMTPQGDFVDPRLKPLKIKKGLASLVAKQTQTKILPLAIEYTFWNDKQPEILMNFGAPIQASLSEQALTTTELHEVIEKKMTIALEELEQAAIRRNEDDFHALLGGSAGVGGLYGWLQRLRGYEDEHMS